MKRTMGAIGVLVGIDRSGGAATVATLGKNSEPPEGEGSAEEGGFSLFKRDVVDDAADKARRESRGGGAAEEQ